MIKGKMFLSVNHPSRFQIMLFTILTKMDYCNANIFILNDGRKNVFSEPLAFRPLRNNDECCSETLASTEVICLHVSRPKRYEEWLGLMPNKDLEEHISVCKLPNS